MADRKISDLTALTTPATGDLIPIVDISEAAAADKNKSITVGELLRGAPDGTAAAPGIAFESDGGNGMFLGGTDILAFSTGGTQAVTIDASQRLGIGTSTVDAGVKVHIEDASPVLRIKHNSNGVNDTLGSVQFGGSSEANCAAIYALHDGDNTAGKLSFRTEASGGNLEERLVIDSSGNVGIGTTSPDSELHISKADTTTKLILERTSSATAKWSMSAGGGSLLFTDEASSNERARIDSSGHLLVGTSSAVQTSTNSLIQAVSDSGGYYIAARNDTSVTDGNAIGGMRFYGNDSDGNYDECARIECDADGTHSNDSKPSRLRFLTTASSDFSPTERMRITNGGYIKASFNATYEDSSGLFHEFSSGNTNDYACFIRHKSNSEPFGLNIKYTDNTPDDTGNQFLQCQDPTAVRLRILSDGDVLNHDNTYGSLSDQKLKQDIVDAGSQWDDLKNLRVRKFKFISDVEAYGDNAKTLIGLVAQEAETVSPGLVKESPDLDDKNNDLGTTTKSVNYSVLYMKAVKALQEAMERIETLEAKVSALEAN